MSETMSPGAGGADDATSRRDFLLITTATVGAIGTGLSVWPLVDSMNPAADVLALASTEVDLSPIEVGQTVTVVWRGQPVFIRRRTADEIKAAQAVKLDDLVDPQADKARAEKPEWLIVVGVCTHLGCVPLGYRPGQPKGDFGGWFCPCHGSHYDTSGRVRKGPAPKNLVVPPIAYLDDSKIRIG